ncbi:MAG: hypothetical protein CM15mP129_01230 [Chloroflexota bacterium]|nr:MAG: hypothetical protein CM15mP129_01230 [Chloroflexota bacterium]
MKQKAIGFKGDNFYNICASFNSNIEPENLMNELLQVEISMGRIRKIMTLMNQGL